MLIKNHLVKKYQPSEIEESHYQEWLNKNLFKPDQNKNNKKLSYSVVMPPPNITGKLHLGHAWDNILQDIIVRQKRMQGFNVLWLPGMDHAGIAAQIKVQDMLKSKGIDRDSLGRTKFTDKVWEWKSECEKNIRNQWKKLGLSIDYDRERFTMDQDFSKAVCQVFVSLYNKGLIYRNEYIINWDGTAQTALSDIEVIHKEIPGNFYHIGYKLTDNSGILEVVTTRPETILGDVAIAVHPEDERYKHLVGKQVIVPITKKIIPIIFDKQVNMKFGTGIVKITPAHDITDFEIGNRHDLPRISVIDKFNKMNELSGKYAGIDRFLAREKIVKDIDKLGFLIKVKKITHNVGHSSRTDTIIEPRLSTQWFLKVEPLVKKAVSNQKTSNAINFYPPRFNNIFMKWMENVHDWVISRQLWWGHRIPAWHHKVTKKIYVGTKPPEKIENWEQDKDVLDTWFSSSLWPFVSMGWPDIEHEDFKKYFPTNTLVTGYDIMFFWVSRMIFQSLEFTEKRPFYNVLIHGLIRAEDGRKMSKSLKNGIDPMEIINQYGSDALRWFFIMGSRLGQDIRFSHEKINSSWNFINKLWNASRFVLMHTEGMKESDIDINGEKSFADVWILNRLNNTTKKVNYYFERFEFGEAGRELYNFIWDDFCDWYIEVSKKILLGQDEKIKKVNKSVLIYILDNILRLLHPILPFVTEEIWKNLSFEGESLIKTNYPVFNKNLEDRSFDHKMNSLQELIRSVRNMRSKKNISMSRSISLFVEVKQFEIEYFLKKNEDYIKYFCNTKELVISRYIQTPKFAISDILTDISIYIPLGDLINIDNEIGRFNTELQKIVEELDSIELKLVNKGFLTKAPREIVDKENDKKNDFLKKKESILEQLSKLYEAKK